VLERGVGPVIAGFVFVQSLTTSPQILPNNERTHHCHLSRNSLLNFELDLYVDELLAFFSTL
jgi:hypothetical protein